MAYTQLNSKTKAAEAARKAFKQRSSGVTGNLDVTAAGYNVLIAYLLKWRASIYRLVWVDILIWLILYYVINLVYRLALDSKQKIVFENLVEQVGEWSGKLPVTFLLGFFVSNVVSRWWNIFMSIPKMAGPAATLSSCIRDPSTKSDEASDRPAQSAGHYRREIARYLVLAWVLGLWDICASLQMRFNAIKALMQEAGDDAEVLVEEDGSCTVAMETDDNFADLTRRCVSPTAGKLSSSLERLAILNRDPAVRKHLGQLVTKSEFAVFLQRAKAADGDYKIEWQLPIVWALALSSEAADAGSIKDSMVLVTLQEEIKNWSAKIRGLNNLARRQLPLVYTQVVIIAVYTIYITDVLSRQLLDPKLPLERKAKGYYADYVIPILGIIHVVFLLGWFKVALVLMDPFGTDEEDFPFDKIFARNVKICKNQCCSNEHLFPTAQLMPQLSLESDDRDGEGTQSRTGYQG